LMSGFGASTSMNCRRCICGGTHFPPRSGPPVVTRPCVRKCRSPGGCSPSSRRGAAIARRRSPTTGSIASTGADRITSGSACCSPSRTTRGWSERPRRCSRRRRERIGGRRAGTSPSRCATRDVCATRGPSTRPVGWRGSRLPPRLRRPTASRSRYSTSSAGTRARRQPASSGGAESSTR